jgi:membrane-bound lytic murein transglycosylase D
MLIAVVSVAATGHISDSMMRAESDSTQLSFDTISLRLNGTPAIDATEVPTIALNKNGSAFVKDYLAKNNSLLEKIRERSPYYFKTTDQVFSKYGLPLELKYLAVIESELQTKAVSRVGAVGVWQLMPATGRILSLRITSKHDERRHFYKSTVAAAKYLRDLHNEFKDWLLVIAAYNAGPGRVYAAIKKSGSRNFWKLQYFLPAETRGHVKKFISTHYFFEGGGGATTLTRDETIAYRKQMIAFVEQQNNLLKEHQETFDTVTMPVAHEEKIAKAENIVIE